LGKIDIRAIRCIKGVDASIQHHGVAVDGGILRRKQSN
jgi:hypothetical protein